MNAIELIRQGIQRELPDALVSYEHGMDEYVRVRWNGLGFDISIGAARWATESDGTGWDAYGVTGMAAMFMQVAMRLDGAEPHRIPPTRSGLRLSREGEAMCGYVVADLRRLNAEKSRKPLNGL